VPNVQWRTPDDGQRNCLKDVEFLDKNEFGKISASVGFIKKKFVTMHGHMNIKIDCDFFCITIPVSSDRYDNLLQAPRNPAMLWVLTEILDIIIISNYKNTQHFRAGICHHYEVEWRNGRFVLMGLSDNTWDEISYF
jgi:hypothetical protein